LALLWRNTYAIAIAPCPKGLNPAKEHSVSVGCNCYLQDNGIKSQLKKKLEKHSENPHIIANNTAILIMCT
jgi:hypothetical protein